MSNEETILKEVNKLFVTMTNVHIDGKPMADLLKLYNSKREEMYAIARANYILGQTDERSQWFKKINEKIEELEKEREEYEQEWEICDDIEAEIAFLKELIRNELLEEE